MADIPKIKQWLEHKGVTPKIDKNAPQFDIVFEDQEGIKVVLRIKDQQVFERDIDYPALRADFFKVTHFDQDRIAIKYEINMDNDTIGVGHCPINDIIVENGFFTDARMEKTIIDLAGQGITIGKPPKKKEEEKE